MGLLIAVFVTTLVVTAGTYLLTNRTLDNRDSAKVRDRLAGKAPEPDKKADAMQLFAAEQESKPLHRVVLERLNVDQAMQTLIEQAGVGWASGQVLLACFGVVLVVFNCWWYLGPPELKRLAFAIAPPTFYLPIAFLKRKRTKRIYAFEAQFPDALQFIARAMRAGHAFSVSLEMLHKEFAEPLSSEFRQAFEEQNLGLPIETALGKLTTRMPLLDVQFFVAAVVLQKRTGGNLAEILENLAVIIRERFKLRGQIRTISAQGRMSSLVLTAIPVVVGCMLYFVNRPHMMFFIEEEMGNWMAGLAAAFVTAGYLIMQRIVNIEV